MDEVIKSEVIWDASDETLHHRTSQPTEGIILRRNKHLRDNGLLKDLSFGRLAAVIPMIAWDKAKRSGYDVENPDSSISGREIHRFLQSDYGKQCLVQDSKPKYFQGGF